MNVFDYRQQELYCEGLSLTDLAAEYGTPLYVYSASLIAQRVREYQNVLDARICYAVKANSNLSLLAYLHSLGTHFDVVSGGELERALAAGVPAEHIAFAGVGKSAAEIALALKHTIGSIALESAAEAERVMELATELHVRPRVSLRINPNIRVVTHPHIRTGDGAHKFGIAEEEVDELATRLNDHPHVDLCGIGCHIGSQILDIEPFVAAAQAMRGYYDRLSMVGCSLSFISLGGGFGIAYRDTEQRLAPCHLHSLRQLFIDLPIRLNVEPGRSVVAEAGVLLTRVEYIKKERARNFVIVDAAMNDLLRPVLYGAYHRIYPVCARKNSTTQVYDVVGPVCETADCLAQERTLNTQAGDLLAVMDCGAYGMTMSSNYNSRSRPAEVLVKNRAALCIRQRETIAMQVKLEQPIQTFKA